MHEMYFNCPGCQQVFERYLDYEGRNLLCPACGCKFRLVEEGVQMVAPPPTPPPDSNDPTEKNT